MSDWVVRAAAELPHERHSARAPCAARLQTPDAGAPVSIYTVARELGHQSDEMVKRIFAHLGATRTGRTWWNTGPPSTSSTRRSPSPTGFVTGNVTGGVGQGTETPAPTEVEAGEAVPEWARRDSNARPLAPERRPDRQPPPEGADSPS